MKNSQYIISSDPALIVTAGWSDFVLHHINGNFFQTPEAYYLFEKVPGYSPFVFACIDNNTKKVCGILTGVVQQEPAFYGRLTSRSIVWGGPVVNTLEASKLLLEVYCDKISGKAIYSQFRNMFDCTDQKEIFENVGFKYLDHLNFLVKTKVGSIEQLFSGMSKSKSRQIKKGLSTAQIVEATTQEEVSAFYELLRKLYKEKVNKPLPPKIFFDTFFN